VMGRWRDGGVGVDIALDVGEGADGAVGDAAMIVLEMVMFEGWFIIQIGD
jgi:hypothetical protein